MERVVILACPFYERSCCVLITFLDVCNNHETSTYPSVLIEKHENPSN